MRLRKVKNAEEIISSGKYLITPKEEYKGNYNKLFNNNNPIYIEIGMGKGDYIIESAKRNPNINYIGIERYDSPLARAIQKSNELDLPNLYLMRLNAINIDNVFSKEIDTIYLNFSDPWPKDRHSERRLTSPSFLKRYDNIFKDKCHIIMKTDNNDLFTYSLDTLSEYGYDIIYVDRDLPNTSDNIMTEYEKKFRGLNVNINKLEAVK